jgi:DivIVA domain-containing protein
MLPILVTANGFGVEEDPERLGGECPEVLIGRIAQPRHLAVEFLPWRLSGDTICRMDNDDYEETLGEILWERADIRAKRADLGAGLAAVRAARNMEELKALPSAKDIDAVFSKADGLTAKQVEWVTFSKAPIVGKRGYDEDEVDTFLHRVKAELQAPAGRGLTPEQVHDVAFSKARIWKRGYDDMDVDAFLDLVEEQLRARQSGSAPRQAGFVSIDKVRLHLRRSRGT